MKIGKVDIDICKFCGSNDFRYGYQSGDSRLSGTQGFLNNQEPIHHLICAECGAIVFCGLLIPENILVIYRKILIKSSYSM